MTEMFASTRHQSEAGAFRVSAPRMGDVLSGALHSAYDDQRTMPDEFAVLLARLDHIDRRRS